MKYFGLNLKSISIFPMLLLFALGLYACTPTDLYDTGNGTEDSSNSTSSGSNSGSTNPETPSESTLSTLSASVLTLRADGSASSTLTITLFDLNSNSLVGHSVSLTSSRGSIDSIAALSPLTDPSGKAFFSVSSQTAGTAQLVATDSTSNTLITQVLSLTFTPGPTSELSLSAPLSVSAGIPSLLTLSSWDSFHNISTDWGSSVTFSSSDPLFPSPAKSTDLTSGTRVLSFTLATLSEQTLTASSQELSTTATIHVQVGNKTSQLLMSAPSSLTAGTSYDLTLSALDAYGNLVTAFENTLTFSSSDPLSASPAPPSSLNQGSAVVSFSLKTAGLQSLTASAGSLKVTLSSLLVYPASTDSSHSLLSATPSNFIFANGSSSSTLSIILKDAFDNPISNTPVALSVSGSNNILSPLPDTDSHGSTSATLASTQAETKTLRIASPSGLTNSTSVIFYLDTGPSALSISQPTNGSTFYNDLNTTTFTVSGTCDLGLSQKVYLKVDDHFASGSGGTNGAACMGFLFSTTLDVTALSEATHTLSALMADVNQNIITSASIQFTKSISATQLLLSALPASITAGSSQSLTLTAYDLAHNIATNFRGSVTFSSSDTSSLTQIPSPYSFSSSDRGVHVFSSSLRFVNAGSKSVSASSGNLSSPPLSTWVNPAQASNLLLSTPSSLIAGIPALLTLSATDSFGNLATQILNSVSFSSSDPLSPSPAAITPLTNGSATLAFSLKTAGPQSVSAWSGSLSSTTSLSVLPGSASTLSTLSASPNSNILADGASLSTLTILLKDNYNNFITGLTPVISSSDPSDTFSQATPTNSNGIAFSTLSASQPGLKTLSLSSPSGLQSISTSVSFAPNTADPSLSTLSASPSSLSGDNSTTSTLTLTLRNNVGLLLPNKSVSLSSSRGSNDTLAPPSSITDNHGQAQFTIKSSVSGSALLIATVMTDGVVLTQTASLTFIANSASVLVLTAPSSVVAGSSALLTVRAYDAYSNLSSGYTGMVQFSSSDPQSLTPASSSSLTQGVGIFNFTLKTASNLTLNASSGPLSSSISISVIPAQASTLLLLTPSSLTAGSSATLTLSARDPYSNLATSFSGSLTFSSSDPQSSSPASVSSLSNATAVLPFTLKTAPSQSISVSSDEFLSTSSTITVNPASASSSHSSLSATPSNFLFANGLSQSSISVLLKDAFGNALSNTSVSLQVSGSGNSLGSLPLTDSSGKTSTSLSSTSAETKTLSISSPSELTNSTTVIFESTSGSDALSISSPLNGSTFYNDQNNANFTVTGLCNLSSSQVVYLQVDGLAAAGTGGSIGAACMGSTFSTTMDVTNLTEATHTLSAFMADAQGNSITSTSIQFTKSISATKLLLSALPSSITAGSPQSLTVIALDAINNIATQFSGSVRFSSDDPSSFVSLPTEYSFLTSELGVHTYSSALSLASAGIHSVTVSSGSLTPSSQSTTVLAASASTLILSTPSSVTAGTASVLSLSAKDSYGNLATNYLSPITFSSSDPQSPTPAPISTLSSGTGAFSFTLKTAPSQTIIAQSGSFNVSSSPLTVYPGSASELSSLSAHPSLDVLADATSLSTITITLKDAYTNWVTGVTPSLLSSDPSHDTFSPSSLTNTLGVSSVTVSSSASGLKTFSLSSPSGLSSVSTSVSFAPNTADPSLSSLSAQPSSLAADSSSSSTITLTLRNNGGLLLPNKSVSLSSNRGEYDSLTPLSSTTDTHGQASFSVKSSVSGTALFFATDLTDSILLSQTTSITFTANSASKLLLSAPSSSTAGAASLLTVTAYDSFNNIASDYTGVIQFSSSDTQSSIPALSSSLSNGVGIFSFTLKSAGSQNLIASSGLLSASTSIVVNAAPTSTLLLSVPSSVTAGIPSTLTLSARDLYSNLATSFSGSLTFSSSDSQSSSPAPVSSLSNGTGIIPFTLKTAPSQSISVSSDEFLSTSSTITVNPASASSSHSSLSATPSNFLFANGLSQSSISVLLKDAFGNALSNTSVSLQVSGSGNSLGSLPLTDSSGKTSTSLSSTSAETKTLSISSPSELTNSTTVIFESTSGSDALSISSPLNGSTFYNDQNNANFTVTGLCNLSSAQTVFIQVDGTSASGVGGSSGAACIGSTFSTTIDVTPLSESTHSLSAVISDASSSSFTSAPILITKSISATQLLLSALSPSITAGSPQTLTLTALDGGNNIDTHFTGTISFTTSDTQALAILPTPYTYTNSDNGTHVFPNGITLVTAGSQWVKAFSPSLSFASQTSFINPASASQATLSASPSFNVLADNYSTSTLTILLKDPYDNWVTGVTPTFTSSNGSSDTFVQPSATNSSGLAYGSLKSSAVGTDTLWLSSPSNLTSYTTTVNFITPYSDVTLATYNAALFDNSQPGNNASSSKSTWVNTTSPGFYNGSLMGFAYTSANGWAGSGTSSSPYNLTFLASTSDYVSLTAGMNSFSSFSFEASVAPASASTAGSVILSNGDSSGKGITLRQAKTGSGRVELLMGTSSYEDVILADTPTVYYRLGDNSTSSFLDSSGNKYHGVGSGVTPGSAGALANDNNSSMSFNGSGYITVLNGYGGFPGAPLSQGQSVEVWFNTTGTNTPIVYTANALYPSFPVTFNYLLTIDSSGYLLGQEATTSGAMPKVRIVNDGSWHYAALTMSPSGQQVLYLDGNSISGLLADLQSQGGSYVYLGMGGNAASWAYRFNGLMQDFAVYNNKLLGPSDILRHYNARTLSLCSSQSSLSSGYFYFLSGLYNNSAQSLSLYSNNVLQCSVSTPSANAFANSANPLTLGANYNSSTASNFFSGSIANVSLTEGAVTTAFLNDFTTEVSSIDFYPSAILTSPTASSTITAGVSSSASYPVSGICTPSTNSTIKILVDGAAASGTGGSTGALCMGGLFSTSINTTSFSSGSHKLSAVISSGNNTVTSSTVSVNYQTANLFLTAPSSITAGNTGTLTLVAKDTLGNLLTGSSSTISFVSNDSQSLTPAPSFSLTNGSATVSFSLKTATTTTLTASDPFTGIASSSATISVIPNSPASFILSAPSSVTAGVASTLSIMVKDAYTNMATAYSTAITFSSNDPLSSTPATASTLTNGTNALAFTLKTAGTQSITAQSGSLSSSASVVVNPAAASTLFSSLSANPSSGILANNLSQSTLSISLRDSYNNQITGITPTLTSSAGAYASITQPSATNSSGNTLALVQSSIGGTQTLSFTSPSSLAGVENTVITFIPYIAANPNSSISTYPAALNANGVSLSTIGVSLYDVGNNLITSGISVTLSSSRGSLDTLSSNTLVSNSSGKATFTLSSTSTGISQITASANSTTLTTYVEFFSDTSSLIANYSARLFDGSQVGNNSSSIKATWVNLVTPGTNNGSLSGFTFASTNGWSGSGSMSSPYNLTFLSSTSDYVSFGRGLNTFTNFSFELSVASASSTTRGSVLLSNADSWGGGFTLRQSKDGQGKVELVLGSALSSYADVILSDSPIAYYRLGDSSTTTAYDSSGNSQNGSYSSGAFLGSSGALTFDSDSSVQFNGTTGYMALPTNIFASAASSSSTGASVETWFKASSGQYGGLIHLTTTAYPSNSPTTYENLLYVDTSGYLRGNFYVGSTYLGSSTQVTDGKWHHAALTKASTGQVLYLDGLSVATNSSAISPQYSDAYVYLGVAWNNLYPGLPTTGTWSFFPGQMDEVAFYYSTLSTTQIANHYAARMKASCLSSSTLTNNRYYLISGVYKAFNSALSLSINGNPECSVASNKIFVASSAPMAAGASYSDSAVSSFFSGSISDIRFYSSALNTTTQASDYNAISGTNGSSTPGASNYNPTVSISSPTNGNIINSSNDSTSFQITGGCDSQSTATIKINIDGSNASSAALCMGTVFSNTINTTTLTTGSHSLSAILTNASNTVTSSPVLISRSLSDTTVARLSVSNFPSPQTAGIAGSFFVSALDSFGYIIPTYRGTVTFSSTDSLASLPAQYTFTSSDNGIHSFRATLNTYGVQSITATDNANGLIGTQSGINVYSSFVADWPFSYGTDSAYTFDSTLIRLNSSGVAQLIYLQTDSGNYFNTGALNGVTYDSSNQVLKLNSSTNIAELDSTWTPAYSSLVGYWKFNGSNSIVNGTSIPADIGPNLTAHNTNGTGLTYSTGQLNQAISFDGVDDTLSNDVSTMNVSGNFTVAAWGMPKITSGTRAIVSTQTNTANAVELGFLGNYGLYLNVGNGSANVMSLYSPNLNWTLSTNVFHHVVLSMKSTGGVLYLDGNTVASGPVTAGPPLLMDATRTLVIGNYKNGGNSAFIGSIDEVAIWNTALSTSQIQTLYQRQSATYSGIFSSRVLFNSSSLSASSQLPYYKNLPPNASSESTSSYPALTNSTLMSGNVGLWHFDENFGSTTFADSSGKGNNGTAVGALITGATGKLGNAIGANGSAGIYVNVPHSTSLALTSNLTILAWIYPLNYSPQVSSILGKTWGGSPAPYDFYLLPSNGVPIFYMGNGSSYVSVNALTAPAMGTWSLLAVTRDGSTGLVTHYLNGITNGTGTLNTTITDQGTALRIGSRSDLGTVLNGYLDEVALWNRVLSATEIQQIYQRGANRIKYQLRGCSSNPCTTESWVGPDGTSQSYFSELYNTSNSTSTGSVMTTSENFTLSNFTGLSLGSQSYLQYRAILESDSATETSGPTLSAVSLTASNSSASISTNTAITFSSLISFNETLGSNGCSQGVYYQLSRDNVLWYYVNNSGVWTLASSASSSQASTASQLNAYASSFSAQVGTGVFYVRAILTSNTNSGTSCELDDIYFLVDRNSLQTAATDTYLSTSSGLALDYNAYLANYGSAPYASGCPSSSLSWYDLSTNLFAGTLTNFSSCSATSGWIGAGTSNSPYALAFNGTNNYVSLPTLPLSLNWSSGLTIEAWVYPTATASNAKFFNIGNGGGSLSSGQGSDDIFCGRSGSTSNLAFGTYSGSSQYSGTAVSSNTLTNSYWNHIAVTLKPTTSNLATTTFYMNGTSSTASSGGTQYLPKNIQRSTNYIAKSDWSSDALYQGQIGMLRVFNRPLSSSEISSE